MPAGMSKAEYEILTVIKDLYNVYRRPVTITDLKLELKHRGRHYTPRWLREILRRLLKDKRIIKLRRGGIVGYVPMSEAQTTLNQFMTLRYDLDSDAVTVRIERPLFDELRKAVDTVAKYIGKEAIRQQKLFKIPEVAPLLASEDPKTLFYYFLLWLRDRFIFYKQITLEDTGAARNKAIAILRVIAAVVTKLYGYSLGIPLKLGKKRDSDKFYVIRIKLRENPRRPEDLEFEIRNLELLRRYLELRIPDDTFVVENEGTEIDPSKLIVITGQDTSRYELRLGNELAPLIPSANLFPSLMLICGVRYSTWTEPEGNETRKLTGDDETRRYEVVPEPEKLPTMALEEAVNEGYILPPGLLELIPEGMRRHTIEAQMNVLEYKMIKRSLRPRISIFSAPRYRVPRKPPKNLFHDGRLMPYEYKLDDVTYAWPHGEIVRSAAREFDEILDEVDRLWSRDVTVIGVVKRSYSLHISPLVLWYMLENGIIGEEDFWSLLEFPEQVVVTILLNAVREALKTDKHLRTFAVVKRLWTADDKLMEAYVRSAEDINDEFSCEFWFKKAVFFAGDRYVNGLAGYFDEKDLDLGEAELYARILANTYLVTFYPLPRSVKNLLDETGRPIAVLPRYEVLLPYGEITNPTNSTIMKILVNTAANRALLNEMVDVFEYHYYGLDEGFVEGVYGIITPKHIFAADRYAKGLGAEHMDEYQTKLIEVLLRSVLGWLISQ